jgi:hypothetical protein
MAVRRALLSQTRAAVSGLYSLSGESMATVWALEAARILLPTCVGAAFGWLLLRRLEEVKSEVVRYSDFGRKWAELFFDASNTFMVSVERLMAFYSLLSTMAAPNDQWGMGLQRQANDLLPVLRENFFRIQRLVALAPSKGSGAEAAANSITTGVSQLTKTRQGDLTALRREIDEFNRAVREAHSEMLASRTKRDRCS